MAKSFSSDYTQGAHPKVLEALVDTNMLVTLPYGNDEYCAMAQETIRRVFGCPAADVHFLTGGTQANTTALAAFLRPYQAVISPLSGHIARHEAGAIEATGHKVITVDCPSGKLTAEDIESVMDEHEGEHMVVPKIVYISNVTEVGGVYTLQQLRALRAACNEFGLYLYIDGARLGTALMSAESDVSPEDLPKIADAFYIGGTKNGALFGEALVIVNAALKPDFRFMLKRMGGMLAKGRALGIQFEALLKDGLYFELASHANRMAKRLEKGLLGIGARCFRRTEANMLFMKFSYERAEYIQEHYGCACAAILEDGVVLRLVTSWATREEDVDAFIVELAGLGLS